MSAGTGFWYSSLLCGERASAAKQWRERTILIVNCIFFKRTITVSSFEQTIRISNLLWYRFSVHIEFRVVMDTRLCAEYGERSKLQSKDF